MKVGCNDLVHELCYFENICAVCCIAGKFGMYKIWFICPTMLLSALKFGMYMTKHLVDSLNAAKLPNRIKWLPKSIYTHPYINMQIDNSGSSLL